MLLPLKQIAMPESSLMIFVCQACCQNPSSAGSANVPRQTLQYFPLPTAGKIVLNLAARDIWVDQNYYCSFKTEIGNSLGFFFFAAISNLLESCYLLALSSLCWTAPALMAFP